MASFAKLQVLGNLGQDPETRYTPGGNMVVSFSIAVNPRTRQGEPERDAIWYRVSAFGSVAERLDKLAQAGHIAKGRTLLVEGDFDIRQYTANTGEIRNSYDLNAFDFSFVGGDRQQDGQNGGQQQSRQPASNAPVSGQQPSSNVPAGFDDVPF